MGTTAGIRFSFLVGFMLYLDSNFEDKRDDTADLMWPQRAHGNSFLESGALPSCSFDRRFREVPYPTSSPNSSVSIHTPELFTQLISACTMASWPSSTSTKHWNICFPSASSVPAISL